MSLQKSSQARASSELAIISRVYGNAAGGEVRTSVGTPMDPVHPKPSLPKNRFPGDSASLAYLRDE